MKTLTKGALFISAIVTFASCATEPVAYQPQDSSTTISLYSEGILTKAATDIQATQVVTEAKVGVYVSDGSAYINNGNNNCHTMAADGSLTTENAIKYPNSTVNIYAYAPYAAQAGTFSVAADQSSDAAYIASDLLYASVGNVAESDNAVGLRFTHKMAKIVLNITANDAINLADAVVTLKNVATTVTLDVETGALITVDAKSDVKVAGSADEACAALVAPHTFAAGEFVTIETADKTFTANLGNKKFEGGMVYTYNIKLTTKAVIVSENITDWTDGGSENITIF